MRINGNINNTKLIKQLANEYKKECDHYLKEIHLLTNDEIEAFIWMVVMQLDLLRGLIPGFKTGKSKFNNKLFESYENEIWNKINAYFIF